VLPKSIKCSRKREGRFAPPCPCLPRSRNARQIQGLWSLCAAPRGTARLGCYHTRTESKAMVRMPFGKSHGQPFSRVPSDYLVWALGACDLVRRLRQGIAEKLADSAWQTDLGNAVSRLYRETSLRFHPDQGGSTEAMQALNVAYQRLQELTKADGVPGPGGRRLLMRPEQSCAFQGAYPPRAWPWLSQKGNPTICCGYGPCPTPLPGGRAPPAAAQGAAPRLRLPGGRGQGGGGRADTFPGRRDGRNPARNAPGAGGGGPWRVTRRTAGGRAGTSRPGAPLAQRLRGGGSTDVGRETEPGAKRSGHAIDGPS
jgi:hypothetical protein